MQLRVFVGLEIRQADDHRLGIERGGDHAHAFRKLLDEVVGRAGVVANQPLNGLLGLLRRHLLGIDQRHRMNADVLADDEFHARQADAIVRQHRGPECEFRIAEVQHDRGAGPLDLGHLDSCRLERKLAVVDMTRFSLGAGHGHDRARLQHFLRTGGSDDGRYAELACDDGRMTGPPAALCDDRGRDLHHRLPVRAGRFRNQHLARPEVREFMRVGNDAYRSDCDLLTDRSTRHQCRSRSLQVVGLESSSALCARRRSRVEPG